MALIIKLSAKGNHLVFMEANFKDGIQDGPTKLGVLAIEDPKTGEATLAKAKKMKWELTEQDENEFCLVTRLK